MEEYVPYLALLTIIVGLLGPALWCLLDGRGCSDSRNRGSEDNSD